jgi:hypothetical protein
VSRRALGWTGIVVLALVVSAAPTRAQDARDVPGFVDGAKLVEIVGEDHVRLRVTLGGTLLRAIAAGGDTEMQSVVTGLESIHAVIFDLSDPERAERARKAARDLEADLRRTGWEELAFVQEEDATVRVLIQSKGERVLGLVALIVDTSDDEPSLVFANVAGTIDLGKLQDLGEDLNVPGLKDLQRPKDR